MGSRGGRKLNPDISGLFEPQLSQKANKINFGNRNGKNDITHQTIQDFTGVLKLDFRALTE